MRIGIVAPSPVPFQFGGAERLWSNLRRFINESTSHSAEVVKLPVSDASFWSLIQGYSDFQQLDVSGFDLVVTGKYPAWMINHPNHSLYMLHPCRGLYDFYNSPLALTDAEQADTAIVTLWHDIETWPEDAEHALLLINTLQEWSRLPDKVQRISWPGPFAQRAIQYLDRVALALGRVKRYAAISKTVIGRRTYFPDAATVTVAYPPSSIVPDFITLDRTTEGDLSEAMRCRAIANTSQRSTPYFFTSSRLEANKRMEIVARAFSQVIGDIELHIAGEGPQLDALRCLAEADKRIKLLGRVSDEALARHYAGATAVPFVPYAEDYGLVAIEALGFGKPLITFSDSGGAAEINLDGVTGITSAPTEPALTEAMQRFADDPSFGETYAKSARLRAAQANWPNVLAHLTGQVVATSARAHLPRLVVALTWSFYPATAGGQVRVFHLYKNLATWFNIAIVCLVPNSEKASDVEVATGLREIRVPKSDLHHRKDSEGEAQAQTPVYDITSGLYIDDTPEYADTLRRECIGAYAAIACHPYFAPLISLVYDGPLWYEAQDVEIDIKEALLSRPFALRKSFIDFTRKAEAHACKHASRIWTCSDADGVRIQEIFPDAVGKVRTVPNCTDVESFQFRTPAERKTLQGQLLGRSDLTIALFLGSGHQPNIEAVQAIMKAAHQSPDIVFAIIGSVCYAFDPIQKPSNVWFLGLLSETERRVVMDLADVALNPLLQGSGTSLKMLDYMACGLPIISTEIGARGLGLANGVSYFQCHSDRLAALFPLTKAFVERSESASRAARALVERNFAWSSIAFGLCVSVL